MRFRAAGPQFALNPPVPAPLRYNLWVTHVATELYARGGSLPLSALVAALPIFVLLLLLGVLRKPAWISSLAAWARPRWWPAAFMGCRGSGSLRRPPTARRSGCSHRVGGFRGHPALPRDGGERQVRASQGFHRPSHQRPASAGAADRVRLRAFIEGAAGFGTPVPVAAAMLAGLGFSPFYAAAICLVANTRRWPSAPSVRRSSRWQPSPGFRSTG